jgi:two-component system response regulator AtoC
MPVDNNGRTVVLGDDDLDVRNYLETALRRQGYSVEVAQNGEEVLAHLQGRQAPVSAVVLDAIMPGRDGIDTLKEIRRIYRDLPVIVISGASSPLDVMQARQNGANDFLPKPVNPDDLRKALKTVVGTRPLAPAATAENTALPASNPVFFSTSPAMRELQDLTASVGWSDAPVLIQGETGVGKEVLARQLHACSPRAKKAMLKLNCAALPSELVESELFGYERGAFTGAFQKKLGMFEIADGGTILLDEIGDMDFKLQAKLLQVLQDHEFQRLGGKDTVRVDVRVIAATHLDLEKATAENRFREDLYYRLNVIGLEVPPLRERKQDIAALTDFFVRKHAVPGMTDVKIPPTLRELFLEYHWPGNVRQLENMVRKFLIFRDARLVERDLLGKLARRPASDARPVETAPPAALQQMNVRVTPASATNGIHLAHESNAAYGTNGANGHLNSVPEGAPPVLVQVANAKREAERNAICAALKSTNWNRRQAAVRLQTDYKGLLYKIKVLSIKKEKAVPVPSKDSGERVAISNPA